MGGGGQRQGEGSELDLLMIAGGIVFAVGLVYFFFQAEIIKGLFFIRYYELKMISMVVPADAHYLDLIKGADLSKVTPHDLLHISELVGKALRLPFIVLATIMSYMLLRHHPGKLYANLEDMHTLSEKMVETFPAIKIVQGLNLTQEDINKGPWAMALTPIQFAQKYKLLYRDSETQKVMVDANKAKLIFTMQLGKLWQGPECLTPYEKALFTIFAAYANYDRDAADHILNQIGHSASMKNVKAQKLNFDGVDKLFAKYSQSAGVKKVMASHAYVRTLFTELLIQARNSGIVSSSLFLWLKPMDRALWYTLNNVGRRAVYIEMAGVRAHWLAEQKLGMALVQPMVDEAVSGLQEAIAIRVVRDIEGAETK